MENTLQPLKIESLIHEIRGQKVMLDRDLAKLYGVETKVLNQAVKRNIKRFLAVRQGLKRVLQKLKMKTKQITRLNPVF